MTHHLTTLTVAEYFAGIGLVRMGLEPCGWRVAFANDISLKKYQMYHAFFPDAVQHYVVGDIFHMDGGSIPHTDLATCSFPCIDLSLAGNMSGIHGEHSGAFWGFIKVLGGQGENAPSLVLVENVPGWLSSNNGADFRVTVQALNELGYACDVFTLNALRFLPQSRPRVFLIGVKAELLPPGPGIFVVRPTSLTSDTLRKCVLQNKDLNWFAADIPEPPPLLAEGLSQIVEQLDDSDRRWWSQYEVKRHLNMMERDHRDRIDQFVNADCYTHRTFFRRVRDGHQRAEVRRDDIAGCLRTAVGGSAKQFLVKAGKGVIKMRAMTPREYARLQGVPDAYPITVDTVQALTGFGDAVCVRGITWIAENVLNPLVRLTLPARANDLEARCLTI
ncbi:MAG: DNA (cytosine-5-)-methyltransferase [Chloroflexi bacterium]|nr:DNA (cytosine-5-)-methyltransferase [Chloroflexota bacterium]